ncbi:GMC oxidoreductase [Ceratocystis platani]|uniref:GMC oxidoreductase n=1 Tax=Ceratocystis fimbriata f. sp. platani TaxID=88771 RepID=A0A0F8DG37_CERFI|nr:GMC oxidoreductase [Ceratocystis platani]
MGKGLSCFMGNGLGGTSLINANIFLPADKGVLGLPTWPQEIREDPESLDQYYDKVAAVLEPETYPDSWPKLHKVELLKRQARLMGMRDKFRKIPQTTRFNNGPNSCGVEMRSSTLSGEDITGINDGSKNTTLVTYVADAWNWGAEIFCECEVRYVLECTGPEGGYIVYYSWGDLGRTHFHDVFKGDLMWVHAKKGVFFGAGAIGTTEILLRSKEMGLPLSDHIGQEVSGNGDMLAFGYNTDFESNSLGQAHPNPENPTGPTINAAIDNREGHDSPLDGWILEDGAVSSPMVPFLQAMLELVPNSVQPQTKRSMTSKLRTGLASLGSWMLGPYSKRGAMNRTQIYLVMTHDGAQARMTLEDDKLSLEFPGLSRSGHVTRIHDILAQATSLVGGSVMSHPFYSLLGKQQVTVHPLGGARMAYDGTGKTGGCNHAGELFTGQGSEVHPGLIVVDAAAVPTSLGVNPLATISALAERSIAIFAKRYNLTISEEKNGSLDLFGEPRHPFMGKVGQMQTAIMEHKEVARTQNAMRSFDEDKADGYAFTEIMSGYIHRLNNTKLVEDDLDTYRLAQRVARGRLEAARFFLTIQTFDIRSYVGNIDHPAIMTVYDFDMWGTDRQMLHFHGYKILDSSVELSPSRFWKASSTLYVTITRPTPGRIRNKDDPNDWRHDQVIAKATYTITARDGVQTPLYVFEPTNPSIETRNVVMIAGAAVDHQVFALPTIPYNTVNYMTRAGYRVFAGVHRFGLVNIARDDWTVFDAREDIRGVIQFVRENYPEHNSPDNKVYTVAHSATQRSYDILVKRFGLASEDGQVQYRRLEIPGYGHLDSWMGRNSWRDVYPHVRAEMDRVTRGPAYTFVEPADRFATMTANGVLMD